MPELKITSPGVRYELDFRRAALSDDNTVFAHLIEYTDNLETARGCPVTFDGVMKKIFVREAELLDLGWTLEVDSACAPGGNENG